MAPAAQIAVLQGLWEGKEGVDAGCAGSDLVEAIDDAVADGVDVINFSIGGSDFRACSTRRDLLPLRREAGMFVLTSAGNSGPGADALDHVFTVADRGHREHLGGARVDGRQLGNGKKYIGDSITDASVGPRRSSRPTSPLSGADPDEARLCFDGVLDPAKVAGKIIVCDAA